MTIQELFDFGIFPVLDSERLRLRELRPADADAVFSIRGDHEVTKYNGGLPYRTVDQAGGLIDSGIQRQIDGSNGSAIVAPPYPQSGLSGPGQFDPLAPPATGTW